MKTPAARRAHPPRHNRTAAVAAISAAAAAGVLAVAAVHWLTAEPAAGGPRPVPEPTQPARSGAELPDFGSGPGARPAGEASVQPAPGRAAPPFSPRPVGEARALAETSARSRLDELRQDMVSRCWPDGERRRDRAQLTFNVAFDASGKEIARGISEDRSAPAGAFARCLRALPIGSLSIPPPGARVAVKIAVAFP